MSTTSSDQAQKYNRFFSSVDDTPCREVAASLMWILELGHNAAVTEDGLGIYYTGQRSLAVHDLSFIVRARGSLPITLCDDVYYYEVLLHMQCPKAVITIGFYPDSVSVPLWNMPIAHVYPNESLTNKGAMEEAPVPLYQTKLSSTGDSILGIGLDVKRSVVFSYKNGDCTGLTPVLLSQLTHDTPLFPVVVVEAEVDSTSRFVLRTDFKPPNVQAPDVTEIIHGSVLKRRVAHPRIVREIEEGYELPEPALSTMDSVAGSEGSTLGFRILDPKLDVFPLPANENIYYFEIKIIRMAPGGLAMAGFMMFRQGGQPEGADYLSKLEMQQRHWAYYSNGKIYLPSTAICGHRAPPFREGDVVGCGRDCSSGKIFFTLNGTLLGMFFHIKRVLNIAGDSFSVRPVAGFTDSLVHVKGNFGDRPFLCNMRTLRASLDPSLPDPKSRWPVLANSFQFAPELIDMILFYLKLDDLEPGDIGPYWEHVGTICACRLVCRHWARVLTPYLYNTVGLNSDKGLASLTNVMRTADTGTALMNLVQAVSIHDKSGDETWAYTCCSLPHQLAAHATDLYYTGNFMRDTSLNIALQKSRLPPQISTHPGLPFSAFSSVTSLAVSLNGFRSFTALSRFVVTFRALKNLSLFNTPWPKKREAARLAIASDTLCKMDFVMPTREPGRSYHSQLMQLFLAPRRPSPIAGSARRPVIEPADLQLVYDLARQFELDTDDFDLKEMDPVYVLCYDKIEEERWSLLLTSEQGCFSWRMIFGPSGHAPLPIPLDNPPRTVFYLEELRIGLKLRKCSQEGLSKLYEVLDRELPRFQHFKSIRFYRKGDEQVVELREFQERFVQFNSATVRSFVKRSKGFAAARRVLCKYWVNERGGMMLTEATFDKESEETDSDGPGDETDEIDETWDGDSDSDEDSEDESKMEE